MSISLSGNRQSRRQRSAFVPGYHQKKTYNSPLHETLLTPKGHMHPFLKAGAVPIEVHTNHLSKGLGGLPEMKTVWENAVPLTVYGFSCYRLSNEDFLIHLFDHLAKHLKSSGVPLYWFCDLYEMIENMKLKWIGASSTERWRL